MESCVTVDGTGGILLTFCHEKASIVWSNYSDMSRFTTYSSKFSQAQESSPSYDISARSRRIKRKHLYEKKLTGFIGIAFAGETQFAVSLFVLQ